MVLSPFFFLLRVSWKSKCPIVSMIKIFECATNAEDDKAKATNQLFVLSERSLAPLTTSTGPRVRGSQKETAQERRVGRAGQTINPHSTAHNGYFGSFHTSGKLIFFFFKQWSYTQLCAYIRIIARQSSQSYAHLPPPQCNQHLPPSSRFKQQRTNSEKPAFWKWKSSFEENCGRSLQLSGNFQTGLKEITSCV